MPLVPAKCPECGGNINIEANKRAAICEFCKQPFVVEDAINNFNTTYNITNNNEIKADTVNVFNGDNIESKVKEYREKISLTLKLKDRDRKLHSEMNEFYKFKEAHNENILVHEAFLETLLEEYYLALEGSHWMEFNLGLNQGVLEVLLKETEVITALDIQKGQQANEKVKRFFDDLYTVIITPISKTNSIDEMEWIYDSIRGHQNSYEISLESLAWDFIVEEHYHESYKDIFDYQIRPILSACKDRYLGYELIYGRFAVAPAYDLDSDFYRSKTKKVVLLDISITQMSQIEQLIVKSQNHVHPEVLREWEITYREFCKSLNRRQCGACHESLSITGKCKIPACEYHGRSMKEVIAKMEEKIRLARS